MTHLQESSGEDATTRRSRWEEATMQTENKEERLYQLVPQTWMSGNRYMGFFFTTEPPCVYILHCFPGSFVVGWC